MTVYTAASVMKLNPSEPLEVRKRNILLYMSELLKVNPAATHFAVDNGYTRNAIFIPKDGKLSMSEVHNAALIPTPAPDDAEISVSDPSDVIKTFLELTKYTVPHGHEDKFYGNMLVSMGFVRHQTGNYILKLGEKSRTLFVAHLDTADTMPMKIEQVVDADGYIFTDGSTILGADDRAGLAVLLYLISQNIPGTYLLTVGEEAGLVGAYAILPYITKGRFDRAIEFDRMDKNEIITHQMKQRCASRTFARALAKQFRKHSDGVINLVPSDRGSYTDTKLFKSLIPECTNIAIGYTGQHTTYESQDGSYLLTIAHAAAKVDWESLPVDNEPEPIQDILHFGPIHEKHHRKNYNMWEMWAGVDGGDWKLQDVEDWVENNPHTAAEIIYEYLTSHPSESLDTLTTIDVGGY